LRLLLDQNLSPKLIGLLADLFPSSKHVREAGLSRGEDESVWRYALENDFTIVSKDSDFHQRSLVYGHPPKAIWVSLGNCTTFDIEKLIRESAPAIIKFGSDPQKSFLALGPE